MINYKGVIAILICLGFLFTMFMFAWNETAFEYCDDLKEVLTVVYEDNLIFDKCYIIEDGEEFTYKQYLRKYKFEGMGLR